jgi:hypothetical protein
MIHKWLAIANLIALATAPFFAVLGKYELVVLWLILARLGLIEMTLREQIAAKEKS